MYTHLCNLNLIFFFYFLSYLSFCIISLLSSQVSLLFPFMCCWRNLFPQFVFVSFLLPLQFCSLLSTSSLLSSSFFFSFLLLSLHFYVVLSCFAMSSLVLSSHVVLFCVNCLSFFFSSYRLFSFAFFFYSSQELYLILFSFLSHLFSFHLFFSFKLWLHFLLLPILSFIVILLPFSSTSISLSPSCISSLSTYMYLPINLVQSSSGFLEWSDPRSVLGLVK